MLWGGLHAYLISNLCKPDSQEGLVWTELWDTLIQRAQPKINLLTSWTLLTGCQTIILLSTNSCQTFSQDLDGFGDLNQSFLPDHTYEVLSTLITDLSMVWITHGVHHATLFNLEVPQVKVSSVVDLRIWTSFNMYKNWITLQDHLFPGWPYQAGHQNMLMVWQPSWVSHQNMLMTFSSKSWSQVLETCLRYLQHIDDLPSLVLSNMSKHETTLQLIVQETM